MDDDHYDHVSEEDGRERDGLVQIDLRAHGAKEEIEGDVAEFEPSLQPGHEPELSHDQRESRDDQNRRELRHGLCNESLLDFTAEEDNDERCKYQSNDIQ